MRRLLIVLMMATAVGGCANLGLGEASCLEPAGDVAGATILNVQAVPTAKYTPCLDELRLGWDSVEFFAEDGEAGIKILKSFETFLTATVTETCDVSAAESVRSAYPDIERFEDVDIQATAVTVVIIPTGRQPLTSASELLDELAGVEIDDRPVTFIIDIDLEEPVGTRVDEAWSRSDYVWIIDELDAEEGTVQLRSTNTDAVGRGLQPADALELIEEVVPDVQYRGFWYFTFDGGCITYEFDAEGTLAETVAADAEDALGFYNALELREFAEEAGFDIG